MVGFGLALRRDLFGEGLSPAVASIARTKIDLERIGAGWMGALAALAQKDDTGTRAHLSRLKDVASPVGNELAEAVAHFTCPSANAQPVRERRARPGTARP